MPARNPGVARLSRTRASSALRLCKVRSRSVGGGGLGGFSKNAAAHFDVVSFPLGTLHLDEIVGGPLV
jgi:hypothetical protein